MLRCADCPVAVQPGDGTTTCIRLGLIRNAIWTCEFCVYCGRRQDCPGWEPPCEGALCDHYLPREVG